MDATFVQKLAKLQRPFTDNDALTGHLSNSPHKITLISAIFLAQYGWQSVRILGRDSGRN